MPRRESDKKVPPVNLRQDDDRIVEIRKYKVITPLYGGGVQPEQADPITVVRASEIRGHLRFWWRATRGGDPKFGGNLDEMRKREEEIFGSAAGKDKPGPSKVIVRVIQSKPGRLLKQVEINTKRGMRKVDVGDPQSPLGYVAFPLRAEDGKPAGALREGVSFEIEIEYPDDFQYEINAALWAWETFGGIGARTRRGFGALQLVGIDGKDVAPNSCDELRKTIENHLSSIQGTWPAGVPHLPTGTSQLAFISSKNANAWKALLTKLKQFRQNRRKGAEPKRPGRSYWPEPEEIRFITGKRDQKHQELPSRAYKKFPRAQFGLPIIFHFNDKKDPFDTTLQGAQYDRLASPLILRPIACSDGAVGLALLLAWEPRNPDNEPYTPPGGLRLKGKEIGETVKSALDPNEAKHIPVLNGQTDVLQAFLDYVKGK